MTKVSDFIQGQKDCAEGIPHQSGKGEDYDRGYAAQYELEQVKAEMEGRKYELR